MSEVDCGVDELKAIVQLLLNGDSPNKGERSLLSQGVCGPTLDRNMPKTKSSILEASPDLEKILDYDPDHPAAANIFCPRKRSEDGWMRRIAFKDMDTPVTLALKNSCWKMFRIFCEFGAKISESLPLESILEKAMTDLDPTVVEMLINRGARLSDRSIMTLVHCLIASSIDDATLPCKRRPVPT